MSGIFDSESPVMRLLARFFDIVFLSVLWAVFSLPVLTVGAATVALHSTVNRYFLKGEGYVFRNFRDSFRKQFRVSTGLWLGMLSAAVLIAVDVLGFDRLGLSASGIGKLGWMMMILTGLILLCWFSLQLLYIGRFGGSVKEILTGAFVLMVQHPLEAVLLLLLTLCWGAFLYYFPLSFVFVPGTAACLTARVWEKHFRLYEET